jgi:hypothetical protein
MVTDSDGKPRARQGQAERRKLVQLTRAMAMGRQATESVRRDDRESPDTFRPCCDTGSAVPADLTNLRYGHNVTKITHPAPAVRAAQPVTLLIDLDADRLSVFDVL